jgi:hypothetical protein
MMIPSQPSTRKLADAQHPMFTVLSPPNDHDPALLWLIIPTIPTRRRSSRGSVVAVLNAI